MSIFFDKLKEYAPTILSFLGAAGVVGTAILAAKAAPKAQAEPEHSTKLDKFKAAVPHYIPTGIMALSTILCIFGANVLNKNQQASLASAYAALSCTYEQYKDKIISLVGESADYTAERAIELDDKSGGEFSWDEKRLFFEEHKGEFFESTMKDVFRAEYHFNRNFAIRGTAKLNEFYEFLHISTIKEGETLGWSLDKLNEEYEASFIDFYHRSFTTDDGLECICIEMMFQPTDDYLDE